MTFLAGLGLARDGGVATLEQVDAWRSIQVDWSQQRRLKFNGCLQGEAHIFSA